MEKEIHLSAASTLPCPGNKVAVLLTADQLMIARDPHFNLSELTRCLQPSPAQPSPAQPSPAQIAITAPITLPIVATSARHQC